MNSPLLPHPRVEISVAPQKTSLSWLVHCLYASLRQKNILRCSPGLLPSLLFFLLFILFLFFLFCSSSCSSSSSYSFHSFPFSLPPTSYSFPYSFLYYFLFHFRCSCLLFRPGLDFISFSSFHLSSMFPRLPCRALYPQFHSPILNHLGLFAVHLSRVYQPLQLDSFLRPGTMGASAFPSFQPFLSCLVWDDEDE